MSNTQSEAGEPTGRDPNGSIDIADGEVITRYTNFEDLPQGDPRAIKAKVDEIIEDINLDETARDPVVIVAGDPPMYNDRLPYNQCTEYESDSGHRLVAYRPRAWAYHSDGSMTLEDGTLDGESEGEVEFEVRIPPKDIIGYWSV